MPARLGRSEVHAHATFEQIDLDDARRFGLLEQLQKDFRTDALVDAVRWKSMLDPERRNAPLKICQTAGGFSSFIVRLEPQRPQAVWECRVSVRHARLLLVGRYLAPQKRRL